MKPGNFPNCYVENCQVLTQILLQSEFCSFHSLSSTFSAERQYSLPVLKEKFELLVQNQFLMRSVCSEKCSDEGPADRQDFSLPSLDLKSLTLMAKGANGDPGDAKIYWRVNFDRFAQDIR